jgi:hypothetical protein
LSANPVNEIAFGVSRDSISRFRTSWVRAAASRGRCRGVRAGGRSVCSGMVKL